MTTIGTPLAPHSTKVMLLGAGELAKEVIIELQRFGVETIAVDRYANAPAMQVAHRSHVVDMTDPAALEGVIRSEQPTMIVPEIEAIATETLVKLEAEGFHIIPSAKAVSLTMNRKGIRELASTELKLPTSKYVYVDSFDPLKCAVSEIGLPCVIKPLMSSSGKGQTTLKSIDMLEQAWDFATKKGRVSSKELIVEQFIPFDYELTLLTVRHAQGTTFLAPIGHFQVKGDYRESWQPHPVTPSVLEKCHFIARTITDSLGGLGIFGVELFVKGEEVFFSEISPRPHDTGLVTLISQNLSEFALHARAILGIPIPNIQLSGASASCALVVEAENSDTTYTDIVYTNLTTALEQPNTSLRLFGKPFLKGERRMGVGLANGATLDEARQKARYVMESVKVKLG